MWDSSEVIPGSEETFPWPIRIVIDNSGNIVVVWGDSYEGIIYASVKLGMANWTTAEPLSDINAYCLDPVLFTRSSLSFG